MRVVVIVKATEESEAGMMPDENVIAEMGKFKEDLVTPAWLDDTGSGECRVPASWRALYKDGEEWKPVETPGAYGVEKDRYNKVVFNPVTTSGLRLEVVLPPEWSAGIQEGKVQ